MAVYYIGADVHSNNTELAIEHRGRIVARYSVPTTISCAFAQFTRGYWTPQARRKTRKKYSLNWEGAMV